MQLFKLHRSVAVFFLLTCAFAISISPKSLAHSAFIKPTSVLVQNQRIAFYRLVRPSGQNRPLGNHFYTSSCQERNSAIKGGGYNLESIMGYVASSQVPGTVPLYRVWLSRGNHFYTVSSAEAQQVAQGPGNKFEGVAAYILESKMPNTVPLYRMSNPNRHFYTTSRGEAESVQGWNIEGIIGYLWAGGTSPCDEGLLIQRASKKPGIWRVENGKKRLFPDFCTFRAMFDKGELGEKYIYTFPDHIVDAIPIGEDFSLKDVNLPEGKLISHKGGVWKIEGGKKRLFPDLCTYKAMGVGDATEVDVDLFNCIPVGDNYPHKDCPNTDPKEICPSGPGYIIKVTSDVGPLGGSVRVTNLSTGKIGYRRLDKNASATGVSLAIQSAATDAGLTSSIILGSSWVRLCGLNHKIDLTG